jgi:hypothetical protein
MSNGHAVIGRVQNSRFLKLQSLFGLGNVVAIVLEFRKFALIEREVFERLVGSQVSLHGLGALPFLEVVVSANLDSFVFCHDFVLQLRNLKRRNKSGIINESSMLLRH